MDNESTNEAAINISRQTARVAIDGEGTAPHGIEVTAEAEAVVRSIPQPQATVENSHNFASAQRRLMNDLQVIHMNKCEQFWTRPLEGDLFQWKAVVLGPDGTAWEGGVFKLLLQFPPEYPFSPPSVRFTTKIFHPNVYGNGDICLDTLKDKWCPSLSVESVLLMIISLLSDPNPNSAANAEAASMYVQSRDKYEERVRRVVEESLEQSFSDADDDDATEGVEWLST